MSLPIPDRERLIQLFTNFAAIDGVPLAERTIAQSVSDLLRRAGIRVVEDDAAIKLGGTAGNLLCFPAGFPAGSSCGHAQRPPRYRAPHHQLEADHNGGKDIL